MTLYAESLCPTDDEIVIRRSARFFDRDLRLVIDNASYGIQSNQIIENKISGRCIENKHSNISVYSESLYICLFDVKIDIITILCFQPYLFDEPLCSNQPSRIEMIRLDLFFLLH